MPWRLNQPLVIGNEPWWWPSTKNRPADRQPDQDQVLHQRHADLGAGRDADADDRDDQHHDPDRVPIPIQAQVLVDVEPNTASTDGPSSRISATVPMM